MKSTVLFLLKKYKAMSGDKKVRIALSTSRLVQIIYQQGKIARELHHGNRSN